MGDRYDSTIAMKTTEKTASLCQGEGSVLIFLPGLLSMVKRGGLIRKHLTVSNKSVTFVRCCDFRLGFKDFNFFALLPEMSNV